MLGPDATAFTVEVKVKFKQTNWFEVLFVTAVDVAPWLTASAVFFAGRTGKIRIVDVRARQDLGGREVSTRMPRVLRKAIGAGGAQMALSATAAEREEVPSPRTINPPTAMTVMFCPDTFVA